MKYRMTLTEALSVIAERDCATKNKNKKMQGNEKKKNWVAKITTCRRKRKVDCVILIEIK